MKTARSTQLLTNAFPPWSNIRLDSQSVGFQTLNAIAGIPLDDLREQIDKIGKNYYIGTADISDPDVFWTIKLPNSIVFSKDDDNTENNFELPTLSGYDGTNAYAITLSEENSINNFWFDAVPDRISLEATTSGVHPILASGLVKDCESMILYSGTDLPNTFYITLSGAETCLDVIDNIAYIATIQLEGVTRQEQEEVFESFTFIHDGIQKSIRDFKELTSIKAYNINEADTAVVEIRSHNFNNGPYETFMPMDHSVENNLLDTFWNVSNGLNTTHLEYLKYQMELIEDRMAGYVDIDFMYVFELYNTLGSSIYAVDMAIEPFSNNLWIVDATKLYLFDSDLPYVNWSKLKKKQYDAAIKIEPQTEYGGNYYSTLNQNITINYIWSRPTQGMIKHRVWVEDPSGNLFTLTTNYTGQVLSGTYFMDDTSWVYGDPVNRVLRPSDSIKLDRLGEYIFNLEVQYADSTKEIDQCIVSNIYKQPVAEFDLSSLGIMNNIVGIDIDSEYKILLLDNIDNVYEIKPHFDIALLDPINKVVYLREGYDQVKIIS